MKKEDFKNESSLEFKDISSEAYREYTLTNGECVMISTPFYLNVSASGGHRIIGEDGISYYIQPKESWYIMWEAKEGQPHFVK